MAEREGGQLRGRLRVDPPEVVEDLDEGAVEVGLRAADHRPPPRPRAVVQLQHHRLHVRDGAPGLLGALQGVPLLRQVGHGGLHLAVQEVLRDGLGLVAAGTERSKMVHTKTPPRDVPKKSQALYKKKPFVSWGAVKKRKKLGVSNTPYDGGRWVTDGGWWVTDGGWWVTDGGWWVTDGGWWVTDGGWWVTDGGWWVTDGGWWVTDGGWCVTDGSWV